MIELLLKPYVFEVLLLIGAVATVVSGIVLEKKKILEGRHTLVLKASGPIAVLLYGLLVGLQETIGFSSVWTILILFAVSIMIGVGAAIFAQKGTPS